MKSAAFIWKHLKGMRVRYVLAHVISMLTAAFVIVNPYLSKVLIDDCIQGGRRDLFFPLIIIMCSVVLVQSGLKMIRINFLEAPSQHLLINIRKTVFKCIQNQDKDFFDKIGSGDIINRVTGDLEYLRHFAAWVIYHLVETVVMFVVSVVMLFFVSPELTWMLLAVMPLLLITSVVYSKKVRPFYREIRQQLSKLNGAAQENIDANRVVKAFVREAYEIDKFAEKSMDFKNHTLKAAYMWQRIVPVMNFLAESLSIITLIAGGLLAIHGKLTLGDLTLFTSLTWALTMPMKNISMLLNDFQRFSTSCEKIIEICEYPRKIEDAEAAIAETGLQGKIEFKNVSFSFDKNKILDNVSFVINPGETVVIMGPTGSGKTTLINLMLRFYDADDGAVLLDGVDIRKRTLKSVRGTMAAATQQVFLFSDTIDGNIAFSDINMPEEKVQSCAEYACADEFIARTPDGYDTIIGERGVGLSGGQRQRIALARALAAEPQVLILDDTTSAVDADTEIKIQKALDSLPYSATKILIAQRISATRNADKILILENGKITIGTHDELYKNNSYYRNICEIQDINV